MSKKARRFIPYNQLPTKTLENISEGLATMSKSKLKKLVLEGFSDYFGANALEELPQCSVEATSLLDVPQASVLVTFETHPFRGQEYKPVAGLTRLLGKTQNPDLPLIPVIYLMPRHAEDTLEHENIHACQYLHDVSFPLTSDQKNLFLSMNLEHAARYLQETQGRDAVTDFIINATCYKTWIEMEANYITRKPKNIQAWMMKVYLSSVPIVTFNSVQIVMEWTNDDMETATVGFTGFCNIMENEVKWVADLVRKSGAGSLHKLILETHKEYDMNLFEWEMAFGDPWNF